MRATVARAWTVGLVLTGLFLAGMALSPFTYHSGDRDRAFVRWRTNPTEETEKQWVAARDAASREQTLLGGGLLVATLAAWASAIVVFRRGRATRDVQSAKPPAARVPTSGGTRTALALAVAVAVVAGTAVAWFLPDPGGPLVLVATCGLSPFLSLRGVRRFRPDAQGISAPRFAFWSWLGQLLGRRDIRFNQGVRLNVGWVCAFLSA